MAISNRLSGLLVAALISLFGVVLLIPNWIALPPDDEGLFMEISTTAYQARELFSGSYPLWDPFVAFGVPQPASETLIWHPFILAVHLLPIGTALALFYEVHFLIGLLAVWAVARHLGLRPPVAVLCVVTYALSSPTINYLRDLWTVEWLQWTLGPLLLLLLLKLLDSERRWTRAALTLAAGLCAAAMVLDGHLGVVPDFAVGFIAFLAGRLGRVRQLLPWFGLMLLFIVLTCLTRAYDLLLETEHSPYAHYQEVQSMNWWRLFFYPIHSGFREDRYRELAVGGVFVVLALAGLVWRGLGNRHADGLRLGLVASIVLWFIPLHWIPSRAGTIFASDPMIIFGIFLAGLTLQRLWQRFPALRAGLVLLAALQVAALVAGFVPFYRDDMTRAVDYLDGKPVLTLRNTFKNQPLYRYFEQRPDRLETRVYMAPGAEARLWRALETREWTKQGVSGDYEFAGWSLHNLRLVNGHFRGLDLSEFQPPVSALHGELRADPTLPQDATALDVLGIGYVLAGPRDRLAAPLRKLTTFRLSYPSATISVYRNPGAWLDATALSTPVKALASLPPRAHCTTPGLLCADFRPVARLRLPRVVRGDRWQKTDLAVALAPTHTPYVLLVSQLYRPGWQARLSNGHTVDGYRVLGGFTGFDIPPGVTSARVVFDPTSRYVLTWLSWAMLFGGLAALGLCIVAARREGRRAATAAVVLRRSPAPAP